MILRHLGWVIAATLIVIRQLYPSVDADTGSGALFIIPGLLLGVILILDGLFQRGSMPAVAIPFGLLLCLSAWFSEYPYPAIVLACEWLVIIFMWMFLQRLDSTIAARQLLTLLAALGIGEAMLAWNQVSVVIPELLRQLERNDPSIIREMDQAGLVPSFALKARLDARLPWGTFSHTNSLGGFLTLVIPLLIACALPAWRSAGGLPIWFARLLGVGVVGLSVGALVLTKCRSAILGLIVGGLIGILAHPGGRKLIWKLRYMFAIGAVLMILGLVFVPKLSAAAAQSLSYRIEYWRGSIPIIADHPALGIGFGTFRDHYLEHKLPTSSEEVADPHNFLVELAACTGIPAMLAYLLWLAATLVRWRPNSMDSAPNHESLSLRTWFGSALILTIASGIILLLGYSSSPTELGLIGFFVALWMVSILDRFAPWPTADFFPPAVLAGFVGLHVHLLAAGGISHPGTMLAGWAVAGVFAPHLKLNVLRGFLPIVGILLTLIFIGTLGGPGLVVATLERDHILAEVRTLEGSGAPLQGRRAERVSELLDRAAKRLPIDAEIHRQLAWFWRRRIGEPGLAESAYRRATKAYAEARRLRPNNVGLLRESAGLNFEFAGIGRPALMKDAVQFAREAALRYPGSADVAWDAAYMDSVHSDETRKIRERYENMMVLKSQGTAIELGRQWGQQHAQELNSKQWEQSAKLARRALELDAATPHLDKKLKMAQRGWAEAFLKHTRD